MFLRLIKLLSYSKGQWAKELVNPQSKQEIWDAVKKMKNGEAGGESGNLPVKAICGKR